MRSNIRGSGWRGTWVGLGGLVGRHSSMLQTACVLGVQKTKCNIKNNSSLPIHCKYRIMTRRAQAILHLDCLAWEDQAPAICVGAGLMQYNVPIIQPHPKAHYLAVTFRQQKFCIKTNSRQAFQYKRALYLYSSRYAVIVISLDKLSF